jgi:hypothetical protein
LTGVRNLKIYPGITEEKIVEKYKNSKFRD